MINTYPHKITTVLLLIVGGLTTAFNTVAQTDTAFLRSKSVAIAYGAVPMEKLSSAVSTINASTIQKNSVTSIEEALNGTVSGLYSMKSGGQNFGARNFDFFIRGKATVASATPLILVDDVEANINLIDFNEVESVSLLKDASALALYGMRGANGVILIKTKRGSVSKNRIGLDFRVGVQNPVKIRQTLNAYD
ncbi:MAG: TonB-dependent receptor plug domain-containing protein, partial [Bacteroidia bacterium]|nr:TonB-dependent receptor plug domain-containing protein [Bacteroidia bacterium]